MLKKIMLLGAAIAALAALSAPVVQGAVTAPGGGSAENVEATSSNTTSTSPNGTIECTTVILGLELTPSSTGHYVGEGVAFGTTANHNDPECEIVGTPIKMNVTELTYTIDIEGGGKGKANFKYTYDITHPVFGPIHCTFEGSNVPVTYAATSDSINVSGSMTGGGPACATTGTIKGDFTVTSEGGSVQIH